MICQLPLTQLLKKPPLDGYSPVWTHECIVAFEELKCQLVSAPILVSPCWTKVFHVYVDASNVAIGAVLSQKDDKNFDHPNYYASWQLIATKRIGSFGCGIFSSKVLPLLVESSFCFSCGSRCFEVHD